MGASARPAFANLLRNLGTGELRIGGGSQDLMPFDAAAANTNRVITPEDLLAIRATLDAANADDPGRRPELGGDPRHRHGPAQRERPWVGPDHARAFTTQGVAPAFAHGAEREVAGIGLGNEPDLTYDYDLTRYLADFAIYRDAGVTDPFASWRRARASRSRHGRRSTLAPSRRASSGIGRRSSTSSRPR